ncbi:hypothetical protein IW967_11480 [Alicyclobacillus mali]|uniref:Uncharacterized protein n=1 Tax=Alicyclobacillus mali (ex Roth et al. 2021) TaxID=1123961 RepID=A0ABS0F597_9BACL|nr:hypothetical protein [Alicyclobacillus mali (ex Roth et al. 2021)]MBF8378475.1 hypothetical protein [Alicyclobacillus mali (ex Roth et al. 2021)]
MNEDGQISPLASPIIVWTATNPLGVEVALKRDTYEKHIIGEHSNDKMRQEAYPFVRDVISTPRFIYMDTSEPDKKRHRYIDIFPFPSLEKLYVLSVIVDADRTPNEVVTWIVKRSLNQEHTSGGIIYDSRSDSK